MLQSRPALPRMVWPAFAAAVMTLGACTTGPLPRAAPSRPGATATWRVVVWGAGRVRDARIADALGRELLRRGLASLIVQQPGATCHVLQVIAPPGVFPAQESIRDGRDSRLLVQASHRIVAPEASLGALASSDPVRALAITITLRIAADPAVAGMRCAPSPGR